MKSLSFLINPVSIKKLRQDIEPLIAKAFDPEQYSVTISYSQSPEHLTELAKESVKNKIAIVVAVGGDGTVQRVGKELIGSESALAIIPIGSGNGLARHFGISTNPETAMKQLSSGKVKTIDTTSINGDVSLNVAGVGFDGHIAHKFASSKVRGFWTYLWMVAKEYLLYQPQNYTIRIDGEEINTRAFLISICNASQYGNKAIIASQAKTDDGLIDVVILKKFPVLTAPSLVYLLFRGYLHQSPYIQTFQCKSVEISSDHLSAHIDGDPFSVKGAVSCQVNPQSLKLFVPAKN